MKINPIPGPYGPFPLPPYAFLPGINTHPFKEGGHGIGHHFETLDFQNSLKNKNLFTHPVFYFSLDLFNSAYYWESHVALEALWNGAKRVGIEANFFKSLIFLNAAGIKGILRQEEAYLGHCSRALELLISYGHNYQNVELEECQKFLKETKRLSTSPFPFYLKLKTKP